MTKDQTPEPEAAAASGDVAIAETLPAEAATEPPAVAEKPRRRSGVLGPLLGGALAAVAGFGVSHYNLFGLAAPDLSADLVALAGRVDGLQAALADQAAAATAAGDQVTALSDRLAGLEELPPPVAPDLSGLAALEQRLAAIEALPAGDGAGTAALVARLAKLEQQLAQQPVAGDNAALQAELDAALARLTEAEAIAATRSAEAEAEAARLARSAGLTALRQAMESGQPFAQELAALDDAGLQAALGAQADTGLPTLAALQAGFADPARETLRLAREQADADGWGDRLVDFLAEQTEARPLTPREGDGADAILSRAEFALSEGRVADALTELSSLDPAVFPPMQGWADLAAAHVSGHAALAAAGGE